MKIICTSSESCAEKVKDGVMSCGRGWPRNITKQTLSVRKKKRLLMRYSENEKEAWIVRWSDHFCLKRILHSCCQLFSVMQENYSRETDRMFRDVTKHRKTKQQQEKLRALIHLFIWRGVS